MSKNLLAVAILSLAAAIVYAATPNATAADNKEITCKILTSGEMLASENKGGWPAPNVRGAFALTKNGNTAGYCYW